MGAKVGAKVTAGTWDILVLVHALGMYLSVTAKQHGCCSLDEVGLLDVGAIVRTDQSNLIVCRGVWTQIVPCPLHVC